MTVWVPQYTLLHNAISQEEMSRVTDIQYFSLEKCQYIV